MTPRVYYVGAFLTSSLIAWPILKSGLYPVYKTRNEPVKKTIIVTGATGNVGRCLTAHLAKYNQRVIMACQDMDKCRSIRREIVYRTDNRSVVCRHLDLSSTDSINEFVNNIIKTEPKIDVLINNAALKHVPEKVLSKDGAEITFTVNYLGPFLLTLRLMDKLIESSKITKDSRIINIIGKPKKQWTLDIDDINFDKRTYDPTQAYRQSKLALAFFTRLLHELFVSKGHNVFAYGVDLGWQSIGDSSLRELRPLNRLKIFYQTYFRGNPDQSIGSILLVALDEEVGNRKSSGLLYGLFQQGWKFKKPVDDLLKAKMVWNETASFVLKDTETPSKIGASQINTNK